MSFRLLLKFSIIFPEQSVDYFCQHVNKLLIRTKVVVKVYVAVDKSVDHFVHLLFLWNLEKLMYVQFCLNV